MKIDGGCHCGYLTYRAEVDPGDVIICHCTDCQTLSGTAFRTVVFAPDSDFAFVTGAPKIYVKTAESGRPRAQAFCPECGTPIYSADPGEGPKLLGLRAGTVRQRNTLRPAKQLWTRSALDWIDDVAAIERVERQ
ncbi:MAG: GFA family protein [Alphaproteobacteria bacterium]|nr:GFA family protein [Alphaproteobacteria bacterium]